MIKRFSCLLVLLAGIFLSTPIAVVAKSYSFPKVDINIQLNTDRSADFIERRTFAFSGSFSQVYWEIPLSSKQVISNIGMSEEGAHGEIIYQELPYPDAGRPEHRFAIVNQGKTIRVEAYHVSSDETKIFTLSYRVSNAVKRHSQIGEFYWKVVGDNWSEGAGEVVATIKLPTDVGKENINVWAHGPLNGKVEILDGQTTKLSVTSVPAKTFVEIRETFPQDILSGTASDNLSLADIKAEEENLRQETIKKQRRLLEILGAVIFIIVAWVIGWLFTWRKFGKEYDVPSPKYVHFPPNDRAPALVTALLNQGGTVDINAFSATLLDLARRKFVKIEAKQSYSKGLFGIGSKKIYEYILHRNNKNKESKLAPFEKEVLEFVFRGTAETISFDEVKKEMKANPSETRDFFVSWKAEVQKASGRENFIEEDSKKIRNKFNLTSVGAFTIIWIWISGYFNWWNGYEFLLFLPPILIGVVTLIGSKIFLRWNRQSAAEVAQWLGFKRFLTDFSHFKDELPQALIIWEEMLVYGTALGVAKKVSSYLPLILSQPGAEDRLPAWYFVSGTNVSNNASSFSASEFSQSLSQGIGEGLTTMPSLCF